MSNYPGIYSLSIMQIKIRQACRDKRSTLQEGQPPAAGCVRRGLHWV